MNMYNIIGLSIIITVLSGVVGWAAAGLGGLKLALAVVFMFGVTAAIICYSINLIENK